MRAEKGRTDRQSLKQTDWESNQAIYEKYSTLFKFTKGYQWERVREGEKERKRGWHTWRERCKIVFIYWYEAKLIQNHDFWYYIDLHIAKYNDSYTSHEFNALQIKTLR